KPKRHFMNDPGIDPKLLLKVYHLDPRSHEARIIANDWLLVTGCGLIEKGKVDTTVSFNPSSYFYFLCSFLSTKMPLAALRAYFCLMLFRHRFYLLPDFLRFCLVNQT